ALYVSLRDRVVPSEDVAKVGYLWSMGGAKERLKLVKADLLVDGSFDLAVDGVDGVFHTASPVFVPQDQNVQVNAPTLNSVVVPLLLIVICEFDCWQQALIDPAIEGTKNVLKSCSKASSVRRVVLTSSCSSIRYRYDATLVSPLNESHWSDLEYCKRYNVRSLLIFLTCFQQCNDQEGDSNPHSMDTAKIRELGLPCFKTLPQMFNDCIKSFREKGLL
ncbi:hypothetical protein BHM03_00034652, partial [Ensete ventricosum]